MTHWRNGISTNLVDVQKGMKIEHICSDEKEWLVRNLESVLVNIDKGLMPSFQLLHFQNKNAAFEAAFRN